MEYGLHPVVTYDFSLILRILKSLSLDIIPYMLDDLWPGQFLHRKQSRQRFTKKGLVINAVVMTRLADTPQQVLFRESSLSFGLSLSVNLRAIFAVRVHGSRAFRIPRMATIRQTSWVWEIDRLRALSRSRRRQLWRLVEGLHWHMDSTGETAAAKEFSSDTYDLYHASERILLISVSRKSPKQ